MKMPHLHNETTVLKRRRTFPNGLIANMREESRELPGPHKTEPCENTSEL